MTLDEFLIGQRWFGSKAREGGHCDVLEDVQLTESLRATFVETVFSPGTHETYQLLRGADEAEDVLVERADVLLELIRANADIEREDTIVRFRRLEEIGDVGAPRPMTAEQSNSSVVF